MKKEFRIIADLVEKNSRVLDVGCGDGTFLKHLYDLIMTKTIRKKHIKNHPLVLIGLDINKKARELKIGGEVLCHVY